jgi:ubiquinone/menaquinone biosynthesis C-methylase UbiE
MLIYVDSIIQYGVDEHTSLKFVEYMQKFPELYTEITELIAQHITNRNPIILDVGMGPGLLSEAIRRNIPDSQVVGVDPSDTMLKIAYERGKSAYCVVKGISENLPLCTQSVDVIVSRFSLPYWSNPQQSFNELFRVLKKDGTLILDILNKRYSPLKLALIKFHMYLRRADARVVRYHMDSYDIAYDFNEISSFLEQVGFSNILADDVRKNWHYYVFASK